MNHDICIIGGGIVGLATARALTRLRPEARIVLLEKEGALATHQTGHNSGVIHAGIYYKPGSLKADLCRRGAIATKEFCAQHGIPFQTPGKLVVATDDVELDRMASLAANAQQNGIDFDILDEAALRQREPNVRGLGAIFVPSSGIVNYRDICRAMADDIRAAGAVIELGVKVDRIEETARGVTVRAGARSWTVDRLVACAGLQSDRLARLAGVAIQHRILPFRGEYYRVRPEKTAIVKHLIYPVPDPDLPFLGIHLTPMMGGALTVGPNAVLGMAREGYPRFSLSAADMLDYLRFPGFWRVMRHNLRSGLGEMRRSLWKSLYLKECQKYCPGLTEADLLPYEAGIRAQAVMEDGALVHDFLFLATERMLHVCNAPSPAATSAIPIGEMIAQKLMGTATLFEEIVT
ncbi:L-2-hydroxyglutarate oxidase [Acidisoma silvae]|uniref:L-2-hydroxyglutarate oxidase n=1 Tax=Acidisoma silvae TaxID=2802396 RepID=A0A963YVB9_9PROT|nr:L-2-hydroxyglutarate oxidase [Acidisoma silvae]MCB8877496.1 L-2-hydroxyglutarate oxidase [Acidisoma silvae]